AKVCAFIAEQVSRESLAHLWTIVQQFVPRTDAERWDLYVVEFICLTNLGDLRTALTLAQAAVAHARATGDDVSCMHALGHVGRVLIAMGDAIGGFGAYGESISLAKR